MSRKNSEYEEYFGENIITINSPNELQALFQYKGSNIHGILSSNYEDLYLIHTGDYDFRLPPFVDIKYETNLAKNEYKLVRNFTLILNSYNTDDTTLIFAERYFPTMDTTYIILLKEFTIDYQEFNANIYSFETDRDGQPILQSKKRVNIYFTFDKDVFMNAWSQVQLGEIEHNSLPRTLKYPLLERKHFLPKITIIKPFVVASPPLHLNDKLKMTQLGLLAPQLASKNKPINTSILKPTPLLPPPIVERPIISPSEVQTDIDHTAKKPTFHSLYPKNLKS